MFVPCNCGGSDPKCKRCFAVGFEPIVVCPWSLPIHSFGELLALHELYPGCLPHAGGLYDQPAGYVAAMLLLSRAKPMIERTPEASTNGG